MCLKRLMQKVSTSSATVVSAEPFSHGTGHCGACRRKWRLTDTDLCPCTLNTDVYYTLAAKKPDSLIMSLENTIEQ